MSVEALKNVGVLNQKQVNIAVNQFKKVNAIVKETNTNITVTFTNEKVFTADKLEEGTWHVKAIKGLLKNSIQY